MKEISLYVLSSCLVAINPQRIKWQRSGGRTNNRSWWGIFCHRPSTWRQWRNMQTIYYREQEDGGNDGYSLNSQPLFGSCPGSMAHSRKSLSGGNEPKSVWEFRLRRLHKLQLITEHEYLKYRWTFGRPALESKQTRFLIALIPKRAVAHSN